MTDCDFVKILLNKNWNYEEFISAYLRQDPKTREEVLEKVILSLIDDLSPIFDLVQQSCSTDGHSETRRTPNAEQSQTISPSESKQYKKLKLHLSKKEELFKFYDVIRILCHEKLFRNYELIKIALQEFHGKDYLKQIIQKETGEKKLRDYHKLWLDLFDYFFHINSSFAFTRIIRSISPKFALQDVNKEISDANSFLVDGFSLVIQCLKDASLDWTCGGQSLHFIYLLERYLQILFDLSNYCYIIFFRDIQSAVGSSSSLRLAFALTFNHLTSLNMAKDKIKCFSSLSCDEYEEFLRKETPTFIALNLNFNYFNDFGLSSSAKRNLINARHVLEIFHSGHYLYLMLLDDCSLNSNRLNAFYSRRRDMLSKQRLEAIKTLEFQKDMESIKDKFEIKRDKIIENFIKQFQEDLIKLQSKIGSKLAIYSAALFICYGDLVSNEPSIDAKTFCQILISLLIHCHLQESLDLSQRAIRIKGQSGFKDISNIINYDLKRFMDSFLTTVSSLTMSKSASFMNLEPAQLADIYDGRLFIFSFYLCAIKNAHLK